jgi:two-component system nitrate/nitrite response regulator NarL
MVSVNTSAAAERKDHPRSGLPPVDPPDRMGEDTHIRVLIADDHAMFRAGLRKLLEAEVGFEVVGEAENGVTATALTRQLAPHVLLLDFAMPGMSGMEVLRELAADAGSTRTVVLTASIAPHEMTDVLQHGAAGVLMKTAATELLYECVRSVAQGQFWVGRDTVGSVVEALAASHRGIKSSGRPFGLTPREIDVVRLVGEGCSNREIGGRLRISEDTVKHHLSRIFDKTGTSSRVELALFAHHHNVRG